MEDPVLLLMMVLLSGVGTVSMWYRTTWCVGGHRKTTPPPVNYEHPFIHVYVLFVCSSLVIKIVTGSSSLEISVTKKFKKISKRNLPNVGMDGWMDGGTGWQSTQARRAHPSTHPYIRFLLEIVCSFCYAYRCSADICSPYICVSPHTYPQPRPHGYVFPVHISLATPTRICVPPHQRRLVTLLHARRCANRAIHGRFNPVQPAESADHNLRTSTTILYWRHQECAFDK